jgi:hypothetical protein
MKMNLIALLIAGAGTMLAAPAYAALQLTPADATYTTNTNSNLTTAAQIETAFGLPAGSLTGFMLYYKSDVGGSDSGPYAGSYSTSFDNTPLDPEDATIIFTSAPAISCPMCFLIVKDGNQEPAQYYFNLNNWNGTETIELTGFWPNQGAISNVAIWGFDDDNPPEEIPEPASLALLGLGLVGLAVLRRRRKVAA